MDPHRYDCRFKKRRETPVRSGSEGSVKQPLIKESSFHFLFRYPNITPYSLVETHLSVHVRLQVVGLAVQSCPICFSRDCYLRPKAHENE